MTGKVVSINLSQGGVPKQPVAECRVSESGLEGDRQRDLHFHGGPNRAVCLYSLEKIETLRSEGHPIAQLTKFAAPCANIVGSFRDGDYSRVAPKLHPGWSRICARVVKAGVVRVGDTIRLQIRRAS